MKALIWEAPRQMALRERETPTLAPNDVLIKVAYAGICGSELSGYLGHSSLRVPPLIMGHEFAGTVAALGESATGFSLGQAVTVNPIISCGTCVYCTQGKAHLCLSRKVMGAHVSGAYAEYVVAPAQNVFALPGNMPLQVGALAEPAACAVRMGELAGDVRDETVLVVGAGPIGLLAMQVLLHNHAKRVFVSDLSPDRLGMVAAFGGKPIHAKDSDVVAQVREHTNGLGAAVTVDAVGTALTRKQCVQAARNAGTLILTGLHEETSAMPAAEIIRREINVKGSFAYSPANFAAALQLLAHGSVRLDPWVVEDALESGGAWFDKLIDAPGNVAKVLLKP